MNSYDDRELARQLKALAGQIQVPAKSLRPRTTGIAGSLLAFASVVCVVFLALALGSALTTLRTSPDNAGAPTGLPFASPGATASSPVLTASPTPATTAPVSAVTFPAATLLAGTSSGVLYQASGGRLVGSPLRTCTDGPVLAIRPSPSGHLVLVVCGGAINGQAVIVDAATMAVRPGSQVVVPRDDVVAWAPDERTVALLQPGICDPQAPVCSVHLALWDLTRGTTSVIRPDETLTFNVRWTSLGLSVSLPQGPQQGTLLWDGQTWSRYSSHRLWIVDRSGNSLLVDAPTGSTGGRVWKRVAGQEQLLTSGGAVEYPLGLDGDRAIVWRDDIPVGVAVIYRGQELERTVPAPRGCLAAQQWDRWLICTSAGTAAIAYSLDSNSFAQEPIAGLTSFIALAALPKP
jgi:hypothetical protein